MLRVLDVLVTMVIGSIVGVVWVVVIMVVGVMVIVVQVEVVVVVVGGGRKGGGELATYVSLAQVPADIY